MTYSLSEDYIGGHTLEIDKQNYESILQAKKTVSAILEIERVFALCANSYFDFEKLVLESALEHSTGRYSYDGIEGFFEDFHNKLNLRIITFLNAYKAYYDQSLRHSCNLEAGVAGVVERVRSEFSTSFDSCFEYKVCDAMRNHAQHHSLPVDGSNFGIRWQHEESRMAVGVPTRGRITLSPYFNKSSLIENNHLRAKTRNELFDADFDKIDTKMLLRGFIAELAKCHMRLREFFSLCFDRASDKIKESYRLVCASKGADVSHVAAFDRTESSRPIRTYLKLSNIDRCKFYKSQWHGLQSAKSHFVSSEPVHTAKTFFQTGEDIWISK